MLTSLLRRVVLLVLIGLVACGGQRAASKAPSAEVTVPVGQREAASPPLSAADDDEGAADDDQGDLGPIPVTSADPTWGRATAPVTFVVFSDFQCPFCARLVGTLEQLKTHYGPLKLRIVWKNNPLPFHQNARAAAIAAQTVFQLGGSVAFWKFHDLAFAEQRSLSPENFERWAAAAGVDRAKFTTAYARQEFAPKVDDDMVFGKSVGVTGTPASFVNGVFVSGAQPIDAFREIIDAQMQKADALAAAGTPRRRIYAQLAAQNFVTPPKPTPSAPSPPDLQVYQVPVTGSPVRGKATALVTLVIFSDFQCPFCGKVAPTVSQLASEYGDKLRIVWKNNPLPFHVRAEPAAELAMEARAQRGDDAFWRVHDALFAQQTKLDDQDLEAIAKAAGLNAPAAMQAVRQHKHKRKIDEDQDLADVLKSTGTPSFFINGRHLVGAHPIEKFREIIDDRLTVAQDLVRKGTPAAKVYDTIQKTAITPQDSIETKTIPAPTKDNPSRGPQNAKVTIQVFSDFECPFCKRVLPTLAELDAQFPGKIRFVWRNLPLQFHKDAEPAAQAAMEAFRQKGSAGFWAMHDKLYDAQGKPDGLGRQNMEQLATELKLDLPKFRSALDTRAHAAQINADAKIADDARISGTPAFVVNGYFISGAQPIAKFRKVVQRALKEAKGR